MDISILKGLARNVWERERSSISRKAVMKNLPHRVHKCALLVTIAWKYEHTATCVSNKVARNGSH